MGTGGGDLDFPFDMSDSPVNGFLGIGFTSRTFFASRIGYATCGAGGELPILSILRRNSLLLW